VTDRVALDSGPLGRLCHPQANLAFEAWLEQLLVGGATVFIPEISDYELRRELIRAGLSRGIERLNGFKRRLHYLPITTATMLRAAEMWADARSRGLPTADPKELDGDVILAAQAERVKAIVATDNVGHLSRFIEARRWQDII
jgi:predicted nucleic acid-binding protein